MTSIVYQTDKRSGITYAYESTSRWDKEKKQSRSKRTLIGRVNPETKEIIPTDGRNRLKKDQPTQEASSVAPDARTSRLFCGATHLLDAIGEKIGITQDLKTCFPDSHKQILSIAYYLILEDKNPLYRFEKWSNLHHHPYGKNITSQHSSELFGSITEEDKHNFFRLQGKRRIEKEYWAYNTTSFSSYSECLRQVQYGHNNEGDRLPQINLALVFGEKSNLPFYYRTLAGNVPDGKVVRHLLNTLDILKLPKVKLILDRGFYNEDNINAFLSSHIKFLIGGKMSLSFMKKELDAIYEGFRTFERFSEAYELYHQTVRTTWDYKKKRPNKGDTLSSSKRIYIHYYYNIDQAAEDEKAFDRKILELRNEILSSNRISDHEKLYTKYFNITRTPKKGVQVVIKEETVKKIKKYYGFFALITNESMDSIQALEIYRNKDVIEKAFGDLKERLNMRRTLVSSDKNLDGKFFVEFVALIYMSYIKKSMQETGLFKSYTMQSLLDKLDIIERFESPGCKPYIGEILDKQDYIYKCLGVQPPSSL